MVVYQGVLGLGLILVDVYNEFAGQGKTFGCLPGCTRIRGLILAHFDYECAGQGTSSGLLTRAY
jgi:hypothetical protein